MLSDTPAGPISRAAMIRDVSPRVLAHGASSNPACEASPITPKIARLIRSVRSGSTLRPKPYAAAAKAVASDSPVSQVATKKATSTPARSAKPGHLVAAARLERFDGGKLGERHLDLVLPGEQAVLAEGVDLEAERFPGGPGDGLGLEIHRQGGSGALGEGAAQAGRDVRRQHHRERAVLEAILEEDVAEARPDHHADAVVHEGPHRHLARRPAAEVLGGDQDLRVPVAGMVQHEIGLRGAVGVEAHVVEEERPEARLARLAEEARGD